MALRPLRPRVGGGRRGRPPVARAGALRGRRDGAAGAGHARQSRALRRPSRRERPRRERLPAGARGGADGAALAPPRGRGVRPVGGGRAHVRARPLGPRAGRLADGRRPRLPRGRPAARPRRRRGQPALARAGEGEHAPAPARGVRRGRRAGRDAGLGGGPAGRPGAAGGVARPGDRLPAPRAQAAGAADVTARPRAVPRRRGHRALPRALGDGTRLRRAEDRDAGARGGDPESEPRGRHAGALGALARLQPRAPGDGARGRRGGRRADARELRRRAVADPRRVALVRRGGAGGDPAASARPARGVDAPDPPRAPFGAGVPAPREAPDDGLPAQARRAHARPRPCKNP